MMLSIGQLFVLSLGMFSLLAWIISREQKKGERIFLASSRETLDRSLEQLTGYFARKLKYLGSHIIKLSWYYGIHKILRLALSGLVKMYDVLEAVFMRNRERARTIKIEKRTLKNSTSHLSQVADHKASTALTESQKKKLLQKKLERG